MSYQYASDERAASTTLLPDFETFYVGTIRNWKEPLDCHQCSDWSRADEKRPHSEHIGWYFAWLDGGLDWFSSEPTGPFVTEAEAIAAAREDAQE